MPALNLKVDKVPRLANHSLSFLIPSRKAFPIRRLYFPQEFHLSILMAARHSRYPRDHSFSMSPEGPSDHRIRIFGGTLRYHPKCDERFPYIYEIPTHDQVHSPHIKKILIRVVDTSIEARKTCAKFEKTLSVPLGPNADMKEYGLSICLNSNWFKQLSQFH